jgi:hypothetical protein
VSSKNFHYYLLKLARFSGWLLLPLMIIYILTGFRMRGELGLERLLDVWQAQVAHRLLAWPLVLVVSVHVATTAYFSLRRWGWLKGRSGGEIAPPLGEEGPPVGAP